MFNCIRRSRLLLVCLFLSHPSFAGSFSVNPINLVFDASTKTASLKVTNEDTNKVTVQLEAKAWAQDIKSGDLYSDSPDLIFFPKIIEIDGGSERLIRVGYMGSPANDREKTYRLFVQELPVIKPGETTMKFAIRMGIPVFVHVKTPKKVPMIDDAVLNNSVVRVTMGNNGNSHYVVDKILARGMDTKGDTVFTHDVSGWYVLAGQQHVFEVTIPSGECTKASSVAIEVTVDKKTLSKTINVSAALCDSKSKSSPLRTVEKIKEK